MQIHQKVNLDIALILAQLRLDGMSIRDIAKKYGVHETTAGKWIKVALKHMNKKGLRHPVADKILARTKRLNITENVVLPLSDCERSVMVNVDDNGNVIIPVSTFLVALMKYGVNYNECYSGNKYGIEVRK